MGRRYVFWRTPDGRPYRGNDGKYAPAALLAELGKTATVNAQGQIQWHDFAVHRFELALGAAGVVLGPDNRELNDHDAWSIVRSAVAAVIKRQGGNSPVSPCDVIMEADKRAAAHFRTDPSNYVLISSLSVKSFPTGCVRARSCEIVPLRSRATFPYPDDLRALDPHANLRTHVERTRYQWVRVKTAGRSTHEAVHNALDALGLLQGLWVLFSTYGSWSLRFGPSKQTPLGSIHVGPVHTLHRPDRTPANDALWCDSEYTEDHTLYQPSGGWDRIERHRRWAMARLARHPLREDLESLLIRYAVALEQTNLSVAFLYLWTILERITDTIGAHYDRTIERAVWPYKDLSIAAELLQAVRFFRNRFVHSARTHEQRDQIAYLVKSFVDAHLLRLIRNDFAVESLSEYGSYLSLPTDMHELETRKRQLARAVRTRQKWSHRA